MHLQWLIRSPANLLTMRVELVCGGVSLLQHRRARDWLARPAGKAIFCFPVPRSRSKNACHTMGLGPVARNEPALSRNARPDGGMRGRTSGCRDGPLQTSVIAHPDQELLTLLTISPMAYSLLARVRNH
jgi:hypothetical protein